MRSQGHNRAGGGTCRGSRVSSGGKRPFKAYTADPSLPRGKVLARLETLDAKPEDGPPPSPKTLTRLRGEWEALTPAQRRPYEVLQWPESSDSGALPWEAAPALLDAMATYSGGGWRPPLPWARWYWRLHVAAPGAPAGTLATLAARLASDERSAQRDATLLRAVEGWLATRPWVDGGASYAKALREKRIPALLGEPEPEMLLVGSGLYELSATGDLVRRVGRSKRSRGRHT